MEGSTDAERTASTGGRCRLRRPGFSVNGVTGIAQWNRPRTGTELGYSPNQAARFAVGAGRSVPGDVAVATFD